MNKLSVALVIAAIVGLSLAGGYSSAGNGNIGGNTGGDVGPGGVGPGNVGPAITDIDINVPAPEIPNVPVPNVVVPNPIVPRVPVIRIPDVRVPGVQTVDFTITFQGTWSVWGPFSRCTEQCNGGRQTRSRTCQRPARDVGRYLGCEGPNTETRVCNTQSCAVNGMWGQWGPFSACTVSCGSGIRSRSRMCNNPAPSNGGNDCAGNRVDIVDCNTMRCPTPVVKPTGDKYVS